MRGGGGRIVGPIGAPTAALGASEGTLVPGRRFVALSRHCSWKLYVPTRSGGYLGCDPTYVPAVAVRCAGFSLDRRLGHHQPRYSGRQRSSNLAGKRLGR